MLLLKLSFLVFGILFSWLLIIAFFYFFLLLLLLFKLLFCFHGKTLNVKFWLFLRFFLFCIRIFFFFLFLSSFSGLWTRLLPFFFFMITLNVRSIIITSVILVSLLLWAHMEWMDIIIAWCLLPQETHRYVYTHFSKSFELSNCLCFMLFIVFLLFFF